jgi:hypothetical protein
MKHVYDASLLRLLLDAIHHVDMVAGGMDLSFTAAILSIRRMLRKSKCDFRMNVSHREQNVTLYMPALISHLL